jgi:hypothetical protein
MRRFAAAPLLLVWLGLPGVGAGGPPPRTVEMKPADPQGFAEAAAPGQFVTLVVQARALGDVSGLRLRMEDLVAPGGKARIPASSARVFRVVSTNVRLHGAKNETAVPEWLLPGDDFLPHLARDDRAEYRLVFRVPVACPPGDYAGSVSLLPEGGAPERAHARVRVRPFHLDRPKALMAMLYTYEFRYLERYDPAFRPQAKRKPADEKADFLARGRAVVRDLAEHGMTAIFPHSGVDLLRKHGRLYFPDLETSLETARAEGMTDSPGFFVGDLVNAQFAAVPRFDPRRDPALLLEIAARAADTARAAGFPRLILVPSDEPNDPDGRKRPVARQLLGRVNHLPGIRLGVTSGSNVYDAPKALADLHEVSIFEAQAPPALWDEMKKSGHEVWVYENDTTEGHSPLWSRFVFGVWGWRTGLDGITAWTYPLYTFEPYYERPRLDTDGYVVPERDDHGRPINTLEWEGIREGVDDRRYLDTLADAIAAAKVRRVPTAAAEATLQAVHDAVDPALAGYARRRSPVGDPPAPFDAEWLRSTRERVAQAIEGLLAAGVKLPPPDPAAQPPR